MKKKSLFLATLMVGVMIPASKINGASDTSDLSAVPSRHITRTSGTRVLVVGDTSSVPASEGVPSVSVAQVPPPNCWQSFMASVRSCFGFTHAALTVAAPLAEMGLRIAAAATDDENLNDVADELGRVTGAAGAILREGAKADDAGDLVGLAAAAAGVGLESAGRVTGDSQLTGIAGVVSGTGEVVITGTRDVEARIIGGATAHEIAAGVLAVAEGGAVAALAGTATVTGDERLARIGAAVDEAADVADVTLRVAAGGSVAQKGELVREIAELREVIKAVDGAPGAGTVSDLPTVLKDAERESPSSLESLGSHSHSGDVEESRI